MTATLPPTTMAARTAAKQAKMKRRFARWASIMVSSRLDILIVMLVSWQCSRPAPHHLQHRESAGADEAVDETPGNQNRHQVENRRVVPMNRRFRDPGMTRGRH